jgi:drug/metabolite transporter (DMT)-like permease
MGLLFGLGAALGWGANDFMLGRVSRALGPRQTLLWAELVGLIVLGLALLLSGSTLPSASPQLWLFALGVNVFNVAGNLLFYRALAVGKLAIVSPVSASFAVVTALLAAVSGERLGLLALCGITLVMAGVVIIAHAAHRNQGVSLQGIGSAIGSALCNGIFFWLIGPVTVELGVVWPVLVGRGLAIGLVLGLLLLARERPQRPPFQLWGVLLIASSCDSAAFLSYNLGVATTYVSVVTALASIFSAVTVLLAWIFLRERLASRQWAGIAALLVGVLMVSV